MKIEHLRYFITLAASSSISKAAEKLFISQQQLNRIITALEDEVQAKLVIRTTNGITLTEAGRDFLTYAQNISKEYSAMKSHFYHLQQKDYALLSTLQANCKVFLPPILSMYASDIIHDLKIAAPNIHLTIYEKTSVLNEGYFDLDTLCFWAMEFLPEDLTLPNGQSLCAIHFDDSQLYLTYNPKLYAPNATPLIHDDTLLSIVLPNPTSPPPYQKALQLYSSNLYQLLDYVMQNAVACSVPDFILPYIKPRYPEIAFTPVADGFSPLTFIYPASHTLSEADNIVVDFIKSYIKNKRRLAKQLL